MVVKSIPAKRSLLKFIQEVAGTLEAERKLLILEDLAKIEIDECLTSEWLEVYQKVVLASSGKYGQALDTVNLILRRIGLITNSEPWRAFFIQMYSTLCHRISQIRETQPVILTLRCMNYLLEKGVCQGSVDDGNYANSSGKVSIISQWHIDSTLAVISKISSNVVSIFPDLHAGMMFMSLCKVFNTLLVVHRMKLGGRYHLLLPALHRLLRCLFISYTKDEASFRALDSPTSLGVAQAAAYGRLLTSICDPTVSSVTRHKKWSRHELNDETKKVRNIAGQHLQYLIMEYCHNQLKGRLEPGVKAALTPGLYAILDVMSQDVMRTINAAMDSSSQSIFKALYEDYRRSGRGSGKR